MAGLTGWHVVILIAIVVLLFGARRLLDMTRAVGQSVRSFKQEIKQGTVADQPGPRQLSAACVLIPAAEPGSGSDRIHLPIRQRARCST